MAWALLQSRNDAGQGDATSHALAYTSSVVTGSLLVMAHGLNNSPTATKISSVTDTVGSSYTQVGFVPGPSSLGLAVWAAIAAGGGPNEITARYTGTSASWLNIHEYSGAPASLATDSVATAAATSTVPDSGPATTTRDGDLIFGATMEQAVITNTAGTALSYTKREENQATFTVATEDGVQASAGSIRANWGTIASTPWSAVMVAFSPPAGPSGGWSLYRPYTLGADISAGVVSGLFYYWRRRKQEKPDE